MNKSRTTTGGGKHSMNASRTIKGGGNTIRKTTRGGNTA
jgi:hypothetical protein